MFVDSHCHLDFKDFDADRAEVLARARAAKVAMMVTISTKSPKPRRLSPLLKRMTSWPAPLAFTRMRRAASQKPAPHN